MTAQDNNIINKKTPAHQNIPGTSAYIIPPPGFKPAADRPAFEMDENNMIHLIYRPGVAFSPANYPAGMPIEEFSEVTINGTKATMFIMGGGNGEKKVYNFFMGDSTFSIYGMGLFPTNDTVAKAQVKAALQSIFWDSK